MRYPGPLMMFLTFLPASASAAEPLAADDARAILGCWQCTAATFQDEPFPEYVGAVYWFKEEGDLEVQGPDSWSRWKYRLAPTKRPRELALSWADGAYTARIYELTEDRLRVRSADDPQRLSFDREPRGKWNEFRFQRITAAQAQAQIEKLKADDDEGSE